MGTGHRTAAHQSHSHGDRRRQDHQPIMGIGMAMFEETQYDRRNGMAINSNLADYVMATHADSPDMDVVFLDYPDTRLNEMGARGIGEIGIAGFAAAVTAAVYHATGVRVRDLPVHIEDLLVSEVA
jgi:xanthine dehydrogenase YagR molybdenum-binding subunit